MSEFIYERAGDLVTRMQRGEITSRDVVASFIRQMESVNPQLNAVVSNRFEDAIREAERADQLQQRGNSLGPLHGLPITIKENFYYDGTPATMGLTSELDHRQPNHVLVQRMVDAGAIVVGKTNLPQLMLWHESDNPLYGRTNNPWDRERTCGGSSGGEAAILAAHGSPLGLGSDIGGSIRIPAHFCGIHGIKPTNYRLTRDGSRANLRGLTSLVAQCGPMARYVDDLRLTMDVLVDGKTDLSGQVPPLPFHSLESLEGLRRVAYWEDDGYFTPSPAIRRAVREAAERLADSGCDVIEVEPPRVTEAVELYISVISADGGADAKELLRGSRMDWRLKRLLRVASIPRALRGFVVWLLRKMGQRYFADLTASACPKSAYQFWQCVYAMEQYQRDFMSWMDQHELDAVLCPPHGLVAMPHEFAIDLVAPSSYAFLPNVLGVPAGVVSTTRVQAREERDRINSKDLAVRKARDSEEQSAGLPVGVQVFARHWREDVVLAVMQRLEEASQDATDFPMRKARPEEGQLTAGR